MAKPVTVRVTFPTSDIQREPNLAAVLELLRYSGRIDNAPGFPCTFDYPTSSKAALDQIAQWRALGGVWAEVVEHS